MPRGPTREEDPEPQVPIFRMKFFGGRNTGEPATPYFGLEVVVGPNYKTYRPRPGGSTDGSSRRSYRRVTDRIYEVH